MSETWQQDIQQLLKQTSVAYLATQGELSPECSMAPYCLVEGDFVFHLSALARHSKNIQSNPQIGIMICTPESSESSPLALPRLSLQGTISQVQNSEADTIKQAYLAAIPDAAMLFSLPDFTLYSFKAEQLFWVGGFGSARKVSTQTWQNITEAL